MSDPNTPAQPPGGAPPPATPPPGGVPAQPAGEPTFAVGPALSYGWKKFSENAGAFILLMIAVVVVVAVINAVQYGLLNDFSNVFFQLLLAIVMTVLVMIVEVGVIRGGLAVTRGEKPEVGMIASMDNIGPYILTAIVVALGTFVGFMLCVIPGLIWIVFTAFARIHALDKGVGPGEAISSSINWVKDHIGTVIGLLVVSWLVYFAGFLLCGVGILVTAPVAMTMIVYGYRVLNNEPIAP